MTNTEEKDTFSRPAIWDDVAKVVSLLREHKVEFILVGGYALYAHNIMRTTIDIDIAVSPKPENSKRWILALSKLPDKVARELLNEDDPFQGDYQHALRINDEFTIDIMPSVAGIPFEKLRQYTEIKEINGIEIPVLDLVGLLKTKQTLRPKDQADALVIKEALMLLNKGLK